MANKSKKSIHQITKANDIKLDKIKVFFKRSVLKSVVKILVMDYNGFRTFKSVKNINRLFTNLDMANYKGNVELESYIWVICFVSKQWLSGISDIDLIVEGAKRQDEFDNIKADIITECRNDRNIISAPEAKVIFDLIAEALQYGFIISVRDEYVNLLDDINMDEPGSFKKIVERLFLVSQSLLDIKHNTNIVANKIEFNTSDVDSMREAIGQTLDSLSTSNNIFKTGIKRLNTLLSPGYMNGKIYVYLGLPGSGKSIMLLKSALDARKYNPDFKAKDPRLKPCVLYITMENTFTETIERIWNMCFDDSMTNHSEEEVLKLICEELGISKIRNDEVEEITVENENKSLSEMLDERDRKAMENNIEIVVQYYPYRSINTDDLFTIIQDLKDENLEVDMLVFDYLKRIEPANPIADNVRLELDRIINELKALAVIEDIPVVTAHQMNRAAASTVDAASRQGKGDVNKLVGRDNVADSWSVIESSDFAAVINSEYKPGTDDKYMTINVVKRRRIEKKDAEMAKYTYLAHPFAKNNGLRLIDDINNDKVLSLQSLVTDLDVSLLGEKANAVPRSQKKIIPVEFEEEYTGDPY
jgi:replicative DNA helicase